MTNRPRSHILETASERAFERVLPNEWTTERPRSDYGIDLRVEIFAAVPGTKDSKATGNEFAAQLKATDDETSRGLTVRVARAHVTYWLSLPYPVLVVRYLADKDELYAMWAHERARRPEDPDLKYAYFRFEYSDLLTAQTVPGLTAEVEAFRVAHSGRICLPLTLLFEGTLASSVTEARFNAEIEAMLGEGAVKLGRQAPTQLRALLDDGRTGADFGGGLGVYGHFADRSPNSADLVFCIGLTLARSGAYSDAVKCLWAARNSVLLTDPAMLAASVAACSAAGAIEIALSLLEQERNNPQVPQSLALLLQRPERLDEQARSRVEELYRSLVETANPGEDLGRARYYEAQALRAFNLHIEASMSMEEAVREWPQLGERPSFWSHRAGSEFLLERFDSAVQYYERAIGLGDDGPIVRTLRADSLLMAGRYKDAQLAVQEVSRPTYDEILVELVADRIKTRFDLEIQARDPDAAEALLKAASDYLPTAAVSDADALTAAAIFVSSRLLSEPASLETALDAVVAARLSRLDTDVLTVITLYCFRAGVPTLIVSALASLAKHYHGTSYQTSLLMAIEQLGLKANDPVALDLFEIVLAAPTDLVPVY